MSAPPAPLQPPFAGTLGTLLRDRALAAPDSTLLIHRGAAISVGALAAAALQQAADLGAQGIAAGDRVVTMLDPGPDHVALVLALALAGAIWIPLSPEARGPSLVHALAVATPKLILAGAGAVANLRAADTGQTGRIVEFEASGWGGVPTDPPALEPPDDPDAHRAILFTSGTTGPPKGVIVTERMLLASAAGCAIASDCSVGAGYLMWEPMHHIGGPQLLIAALACQARLVLVPRFSASRFWDQVRRHDVTRIHYLGGIPEILLRAPPSAGDRNHAVTLGFGGGCRADIRRAFQSRFGVPLREVYGMTEASSFATINLDGTEGAIGAPVPWFDVELHDASGHVLDGAATGQIVVRERQAGLLTPGYLGDPQASAKLLKDGRLFTGDLARRDRDGHLYFLGRTTDSLRRRGENISAWEIETALAAHPDIAEIAVTGVPSQIGDHDILCHVLLREGVDYDPAALAAWSRENLPRPHVPRYWKRVERFERTPSQRIRKGLLDRDITRAFDLGDR